MMDSINIQKLVLEQLCSFILSRFRRNYFFDTYNKVITCGDVQANFEDKECICFENWTSILVHILKESSATKFPIVLSLQLYYFVAGVLLTTLTYCVSKFIENLVTYLTVDNDKETQTKCTSPSFS